MTDSPTLPQTRPPVQKWPARDLIRLWPWLLPAVLLLIFTPRVLHGGLSQALTALAAWGMVWMTFFITRRLWGHHRGHAAATMLMFTLGLFAAGGLPLPDMTLCLLILASMAALAYERAWLFFSLVGLGLILKGPVAALVPSCAAIGWWLAGGMRERGPWMAGSAITLIVCLASRLWTGLPTVMSPAVEVHANSWWQFLPVLFLALLPWSLCTPRVLRQGWRRLREGNLRPRHGLLAGWLLPSLWLMHGTFSTSALLLVPALVITFCPPLADARRLWKIGTVALLLWLGAAMTGHGLLPDTYLLSAHPAVIESPRIREIPTTAASPKITALNLLLPASYTPVSPLHR